MCVLLGILFIINVEKCFEVRNQLKIESEAIEDCRISDVTRWLMKNNFNVTLLTLNTNLHVALRFYSDLRIATQCIYPDQPDANILKNIIKRAKSIDMFIFDLQSEKDSATLKDFLVSSQEQGRKVIERKRFFWADGSTRFILYSLE